MCVINKIRSTTCEGPDGYSQPMGGVFARPLSNDRAGSTSNAASKKKYACIDLKKKIGTGEEISTGFPGFSGFATHIPSSHLSAVKICYEQMF